MGIEKTKKFDESPDTEALAKEVRKLSDEIISEVGEDELKESRYIVSLNEDTLILKLEMLKSDEK